MDKQNNPRRSRRSSRRRFTWKSVAFWGLVCVALIAGVFTIFNTVLNQSLISSAPIQINFPAVSSGVVPTTGTAVITGANNSVTVPLAGMTPNGKVNVWQESSTGGHISSQVSCQTDQFTISVETGPEIQKGDGLTFNFGWSLVQKGRP